MNSSQSFGEKSIFIVSTFIAFARWNIVNSADRNIQNLTLEDDGLIDVITEANDGGGGVCYAAINAEIDIVRKKLTVFC